MVVCGTEEICYRLHREDYRRKQSRQGVFERFRVAHVSAHMLKLTHCATQTQENARQVSTEEAAAYAARMGCLFVETSAKTATGVCRAFRDVVERVAETPELWAVQEPRRTPPLPKSPPSLASDPEAQVENDREPESGGRAKVIGGFVVTPNTIRFGRHYHGQ